MYKRQPLYSVNGVLNGILVNGGVIGDLMFYGAGAGKLPTASAVVADMVDAARNQQVTVMQRWSAEKLELGDWKTVSYTHLGAAAAELCRLGGSGSTVPQLLRNLYGLRQNCIGNGTC